MGHKDWLARARVKVRVLENWRMYDYEPRDRGVCESSTKTKLLYLPHTFLSAIPLPPTNRRPWLVPEIGTWLGLIAPGSHFQTPTCHSLLLKPEALCLEPPTWLRATLRAAWGGREPKEVSPQLSQSTTRWATPPAAAAATPTPSSEASQPRPSSLNWNAPEAVLMQAQDQDFRTHFPLTVLAGTITDFKIHLDK